MADVTVRLATENDVPQILALIRTLVTVYGEPLPEERAMSLVIAHQIRTDNHEYVIAESGGHLGGCVLICYHLSTWTASSYATLHEFVVHEDWRNHGLGSTMLAYARDRARIKGCARLELAIRSRQDQARQFFQRWGFRRVDRELMCLELGPSGDTC